MSQPSNGITPEVIRGVMPPYQLSPDLLQATFAAIPRTTAGRHHRLAPRPHRAADPGDLRADARQRRPGAHRRPDPDLPGTRRQPGHQAHAPGTDLPLMCRLARTAATLVQTVATLEKSLTRHQQKPAPFFGTVLSDAVDIPALDATWRSRPDQPPGGARCCDPNNPARARSAQPVPAGPAHPTVGGPRTDRAAAAAGSPAPPGRAPRAGRRRHPRVDADAARPGPRLDPRGPAPPLQPGSRQRLGARSRRNMM